MNLADLRNDYRRGTLRRGDLAPDPFAQLTQWMNEAIKAGVIEPTAMSLATVSPEGMPSLRTVLLKGIEEGGLLFYTNLGSRKAGQLEKNAAVSLLLPWLAMERQVMVTGRVSPLSREKAAAYFASRPRESQLAAWASRQSSELSGRAELETALAQVRAQFGEGPIPLPPFWGGYRVEAASIEFWQGGAHRLHDRFEYRPTGDGGWSIHRLSP